jgi:hypothetical protein
MDLVPPRDTAGRGDLLHAARARHRSLNAMPLPFIG